MAKTDKFHFPDIPNCLYVNLQQQKFTEVKINTSKN